MKSTFLALYRRRSLFTQHFSNKVRTDRSQVTLSSCEGLAQRLAELLHPNKLRVMAPLTVLDQEEKKKKSITKRSKDNISTPLHVLSRLSST